jgi:peptide/nickel transport system permease protein
VIALITRRLGTGAIVLLLVAIATFALFFVAPHDVATAVAGKQASPETIALVNERLGLDRPIAEQFIDYLWRLLHGDLGFSYYNSLPVTDLIGSRLGVTASLAVGAVALNILIGIPLGVLSAAKVNTLLDRVISAVALFLHSVPGFLLGIALLYIFFFQLHRLGISLFPGSGYVPLNQDPMGWFRSLALPWLAVALAGVATVTRLTRSGMLDVLNEDYIRTARAVGTNPRGVIWIHALRAAITSVVTHMGMLFAHLLGGAVLIEQVFGLPGVGQLAFHAVSEQDLPVLMGTILLATVFVVISSIVVDILYPLLDPKTRPS